MGLVLLCEDIAASDARMLLPWPKCHGAAKRRVCGKSSGPKPRRQSVMVGNTVIGEWVEEDRRGEPALPSPSYGGKIFWVFCAIFVRLTWLTLPLYLRPGRTGRPAEGC